jgi:hypothetical protein
MLTIAAAIVLFIANGGAAASEALEPDPAAMTRSQIRAFNAKIDKTHRHYIRCERRAATGSFVAREVTCRTNAQWEAAAARGNQEARDLMDELKSKSWDN